MLEEILKIINNYFYATGEKGSYNIQDNKLTVKRKYIQGQYIKIEGSIMNNGVHKVLEVSDNQITLEEAINEEFEGVIYGLAIPKDIIRLEPKIKEFESKVKNSVYVSESVGGYSYTKAADKNGNVQSWVGAFANDLRPYRRITSGKRRIKLC